MSQAANLTKQLTHILLLAVGAVVTLATSAPDDNFRSESVTDLWIVANVYDGQTAVPEDVEIALTLGRDDFGGPGENAIARARRAFDNIRLYPEDDPLAEVALQFDIFDNDTTVSFPLLASDTWYVFDLAGVAELLTSDRRIPEPLAFRTGSGPQVTGLFRNDDTLFVVFSEPMDPDTLRLAHDGVDIFWQEGDTLKSIVYDLNLADFTYDAEGNIFRVAPVRFLDAVWVKVSGDVMGMSGAYLDGNGNDIPGEVGDDYLEATSIDLLETCVSREDIPVPCVTADEVPDSWGWSEW